jgi:hypothetical protein
LCVEVTRHIYNLMVLGAWDGRRKHNISKSVNDEAISLLSKGRQTQQMPVAGIQNHETTTINQPI